MPLDIPDAPSCVFCEVLDGQRPYTVLYRGSRVATLVTREQRGIGHVLVMPLAHRPSILDLDDAELDPLLRAVRDAARAISAAHDPAGIAIWQNNGRPAHQTVGHLHIHVAGTNAGGANWGQVPRLDVTDTDRVADTLARHLGARP